VGTNGVVIGRQHTATIARIKDEFDRPAARYAVDAGPGRPAGRRRPGERDPATARCAVS
jgi:hypothetical protein